MSTSAVARPSAGRWSAHESGIQARSCRSGLYSRFVCTQSARSAARRTCMSAACRREARRGADTSAPRAPQR